jgi:hypothetical protein
MEKPPPQVWRCARCPETNRHINAVLPEMYKGADEMTSRSPFHFIKGALRFLKAQKQTNQILIEADTRGYDCEGPILQDPSDPENSPAYCGMTARGIIATSFEIDLSDTN